NEAFVRMLYTQATGLTITDEALAEALETIESGSDVVSARASWASSALNAAASGDIGIAMIVYRTMLGRWPNAVELIEAQAALYGATGGSSSTTGSIESSNDTETFVFNYTANDTVTVRALPDSSTGLPLTDATLSVLDSSGNQVAYNDDSYFGGSYSTNPTITFSPTQTGAYSVVVGGGSGIYTGDFTLTSVSTNLASPTVASAQALVTSLQDDYAALYGSFPTNVTASDLSGSALINQLFTNKHGGSPSAFNQSRLRLLLTGSEYAGDTAAFTAAFATDNLLSGYQHSSGPLSSVLSYIVPNDPSSYMPVAMALRILLDQEPGDALVSSYIGDSFESSLELMLRSEDFFGRYMLTNIGGFVASSMAALGVFDLSLNTPEADADNDGQSNLFELALGSNPTDSSDTVPPLTVVQEGADFVVSFLRLDPASAPVDLTVSINCSPDLEEWSGMDATVSSDQSNVPIGYIRYELRIQTESDPQCFIRTGVLE
ncbi:MAG: pre-peptidase C-terminal domain-containing protein, partial [Verrucomicrobiota bacterium]|nr:pre-peptidase C-terminal domain-containing protein [Verrucomicrobiota bacterium]